MTMQRGQQSWQVSATHNGVRKRITIHDQTKTELAKQTMLNAMRDGKNIDNALANIGIFFDTKNQENPKNQTTPIILPS